MKFSEGQDIRMAFAGTAALFTGNIPKRPFLPPSLNLQGKKRNKNQKNGTGSKRSQNKKRIRREKGGEEEDTLCKRAVPEVKKDGSFSIEISLKMG